MRWLRLVATLLATVTVVGCSAGPKAIRSSYTSYNETLHYNRSQQMLLNLVRMKYRETPLFLKVSALNTSYDMQISAGANFGRASTVGAWGANLGGGFSVRPTVTYTPLEGATFVTQVLKEVEPDTFVLLYQSGWRMRTLLNIVAERVGTYMNNEDDPSYKDFKLVVEVLHEAQKNDNLHFFREDDELKIRLITDRETLKDPPGSSEMKERVYPFSAIQLRSLNDIMFFLSKNTQVPAERADQVKHGEPNGWMTIHESADVPEDALVWVSYAGHYYSISASDIETKDTFALLKLLYEVQAGDIQTVQPLLTIPVGIN